MSFPSLHRSGFFALALIFALPACAPERDDDGDGGGGGVYGNTLAVSLFTEVDYGPSADYRQGVVVMVDDPDWSCADLSWGGALDWWSLDDDVAWVQAFSILGDDQGGWERDYESQYTWTQMGGGWSADAAFFWGQVGVGGEDVGVPVGREMTGSLGTQGTEADDLLTIASRSDDEVRGGVVSTAGEYAFVATHCGVVDGGIDGDGDDPPPEPTPG